MTTILKKLTSTQNSIVTIPLRLGVGVTMFGHGAQKLFGWFGGYGLEGTADFFSTNLGLNPGWLFALLAAGTEFFGGLLLIAGLATRISAFLISFTMLVAIITAHNSGFFAPSGMEYPLVLLFSSLSLAIYGGGRYSLDQRLVPTAN